MKEKIINHQLPRTRKVMDRKRSPDTLPPTQTNKRHCNWGWCSDKNPHCLSGKKEMHDQRLAYRKFQPWIRKKETAGAIKKHHHHDYRHWGKLTCLMNRSLKMHQVLVLVCFSFSWRITDPFLDDSNSCPLSAKLECCYEQLLSMDRLVPTSSD